MLQEEHKKALRDDINKNNHTQEKITSSNIVTFLNILKFPF